jgi:hypothetical protein
MAGAKIPRPEVPWQPWVSRSRQGAWRKPLQTTDGFTLGSIKRLRLMNLREKKAGWNRCSSPAPRLASLLDHAFVRPDFVASAVMAAVSPILPTQPFWRSGAQILSLLQIALAP